MIVADYSHISRLLNRIAKTLVKRRLTLSVCESCTGGMFGSIITSISGSSRYFLGGIIAYSNKVKEEIAGVDHKIIKKYGAVNAEVAREMANGVRKKLKSDIGISITGIAGPTGGSKNKPVGLVYIAIADKEKAMGRRFLLKGKRRAIRIKACQATVRLLNNFLTKPGAR